MLVHVQEGEGIAILSSRVRGGGQFLPPPLGILVQLGQGERYEKCSGTHNTVE